MSTHHNVHVATSTRRRWKVTQAGRTLSTHFTKRTARIAGRRAAKRERVELVTHDRAGRIRKNDSYGRKGTRKGTGR